MLYFSDFCINLMLAYLIVTSYRIAVAEPVVSSVVPTHQHSHLQDYFGIHKIVILLKKTHIGRFILQRHFLTLKMV